jgi:outer membrane lipoprotein SlyB
MDVQARSASAAPLHPVLWVAALSITAFSAVGIAALTGAFERPAEAAPMPVAAVVAMDVAPVVTPQPVVPTAEADAATKPVVKAVPKDRPLAQVQAPTRPPVTHDTDARPVRVAQQTYDSGIDVIAAEPSAIDDRVESARAGNEYRVPPVPVCLDCGLVESIREVQVAADPSGLGAAAGGVVGGLLGNNVGKGSGRTIATIIGIAGGAYAGHQIEKTQRKTARHEIGVRMTNGEYRTVTLDSVPTWQVGDKVKVLNGTLVPVD